MDLKFSKVNLAVVTNPICVCVCLCVFKERVFHWKARIKTTFVGCKPRKTQNLSFVFPFRRNVFKTFVYSLLFEIIYQIKAKSESRDIWIAEFLVYEKFWY